MRRDLKGKQFNIPNGNIGVFMQVTLAITFMYLILIGYTMLGVTGVLFVSITFLLALLSPFFYRAIQGMMRNRKKTIQNKCQPLEPGVKREG